MDWETGGMQTQMKIKGDVTTKQQTCNAPEGYVLIGGDCDDANVLVFPGAIEECDGVDVSRWTRRIAHVVL